MILSSPSWVTLIFSFLCVVDLILQDMQSFPNQCLSLFWPLIFSNMGCSQATLLCSPAHSSGGCICQPRPQHYPLFLSSQKVSQFSSSHFFASSTDLGIFTPNLWVGTQYFALSFPMIQLHFQHMLNPPHKCWLACCDVSLRCMLSELDRVGVLHVLKRDPAGYTSSLPLDKDFPSFCHSFVALGSTPSSGDERILLFYFWSFLPGDIQSPWIVYANCPPCQLLERHSLQ